MKLSIAVGSAVLLAASVLVAAGGPAVAAHPSHKPVVTAVKSNRGATVGYSHVIITGSRFSGAPKVTFGSIPATDVRVLSSHTLIVYAPVHRHGIVHVRVRTAAGTSPRSDDNLYTYVHQVGPGTWQAQTAPVPAGEPVDDFVAESTSCPTTTTCYSAGSYGPADEDAADIGPLISTRVSGEVATQQAPVPNGADPAQASLGPISCPTVGNCVALGLYDNSHRVFAVVLANGTWTASTVDPNEDSHLTRIGGLSCAAAGECVAVASQTNVSDNSHDSVVLRLHKGAWTTSVVVPPAKGGTELDNVDCASSSYCLASGYFGHGTRAVGAFTVQVVDGKQTVRAIPDAPHQGHPTGTSVVQCPAVGRCTILTAFADSDSGGKDASDFVTVENGRSFTFRPITLPVDADPLSLFAYGSGTSSMSCPAVSVCYAASSYETKGFYIASVARLDHGKVFFYNLPRPEHPREDVQVDDIDCATTTACTAVGAADLIGKTDPFQTVGAYFTFADGVWTPEVAPKAAGQHGGATSTEYTSVECPAAGACTADGSYDWDPQPYDDDGNTYYSYDNSSGLVSIETPN